MRQQKRCIICGDPEYVPCYCQKHYEARMDKIRERSEAQGTLKSCGMCGGQGHNMRTCPDRPRKRKPTKKAKAKKPAYVELFESALQSA